jgi:DNA-binding NarL/FixJ family response regulator
VSTTGPISIVVVEDHRVLAEALEGSLSAQTGMEVVGTVSTLRDALELVSERSPDVVLMDVRLPDGDGVTGTAQVLQRSPRTKVIVLSASTGVEVIARAVEAGAAGFLPKTTPLQEVIDAIVRADAGAALFAPHVLREVTAHLRDQHRRPGADLTRREHEVLQLLADATTTDAIAEELVLSTHTVRNHVRNILGKLGAHSKLEAVAIAVREGLVEVSAQSRGERS